MRKVSVLLLIVMLFNFIFSNYVYAIDEVEGQKATYSKESFSNLTNEGKVNLNGSEVKISASTSSVGSASGITASIFSPIFMVLSLMMTQVANSGGLARTEGNFSAANNFWFTISSLVFGEYLLFDGKIYQTTRTLNSAMPETAVTKLMDGIKNTAMGMYQLIRLVGLALFLILLIYSGARLLGATLADERAKWKKVILTWVVGLIFIFFTQYIIIFLNVIVDKVIDALYQAKLSLEDAGYNSFEVVIVTTSLENLSNVAGIKALAYALEYSVFVFFQMLFFFKYIIRAFKLILLVAISPIIAALHAFNKISGKSNNILGEWLKQYTANLIMQPMHAMLYLIFIFTASQIAINAPLLALVFIWALVRAEKIVKLMLNINVGKLGSIFTGKK